ncbi:MAG: amidohydrolase family protein [Halioglobus sp.]|nr:amidohydrolase family protein [Halioglobus sp.]
MHDMVIRGGKVYDGTGADPVMADVAIDGDRIAVVGVVEQRGREEIDATGKIVTPGFVDIHTHFDGQVTWDPLLAPSSYHGVTTIVTGNCGVGFAPCKPEQRNWLIGLMEGVEDIPGTALHEGIQWDWETFPEYLDVLEKKPLALDVGTQIPHGAVRTYVMGQRGAEHAAATAEEISSMAEIVGTAIRSGALGFSTSRTEKHKDSSGVLTPTITAHEDELLAIARAVGATGTGVLQGISDFYNFDAEFELFKNMARESGRPISLTVEQQDARPEWWTQLLDGVTAAQAEGIRMYGQVPPRATGVLQGLTATLNPFFLYEVYQEIAALPLEEKVAVMRTPEFRTRLLNSNIIEFDQPLLNEILYSHEKLFRLREPVNYEPDPKDSFTQMAAAQGLTPQELIYDALLEKDGRALLYLPLFNYENGNLDHVKTMLDHPYTFSGLGDAGAHCGALCDASFPTSLIQHWGKDRTRGPKIPLQKLIKMQTSETAQQLGLMDRGVLKPGYKADINIIDYEALRPCEPEVVYDLPANGRRLMQKAVGYEATLIAGKVAFRHGESTGQLNGKLLRGSQPAPV